MKLSKLAEVIHYIIKKANEQKISPSKIQIIKLVYLLQVEFVRYTGNHLFKELNFYKEEHGPVSSTIYKEVSTLQSLKLISVYESLTPGYKYPKQAHKLLVNIKYAIDDDILVFIDSVLDDYICLTHRELLRVVYETEPMISTTPKMKLDMDKVGLNDDALEAMSMNVSL